MENNEEYNPDETNIKIESNRSDEIDIGPKKNKQVIVVDPINMFEKNMRSSSHEGSRDDDSPNQDL